MRYLFVFSLILTHFAIEACDVCGCSAGASSMGILPQFQKNVVGVRYSYLSFANPAADLYANLDETVKMDHAHTTQFWLRYYPLNRWQLFAFVPYKVHQRNFLGGNSVQIQGLGDISATLNYTLINTGDSLGRRWKNTLLIGGGIKLPTGKYRQRDENLTLLPANFQVGNGAYTFSVNAIYTTRINKVGINADVFYRMNSKNESFYQPGNQWNSSLSLFYWKNIKMLSLLPSVGLYAEGFAKDKEYDLELQYSGGKVLLLNGGLDFYYKRLIVAALFQYPLTYDIPSAQTSPKWRSSIGISLLF